MSTLEKTFHVGIVGAGHIAEKIARTISKMQGFDCLAIASRSLEKAQAFAEKFSIERAYGSYEELLEDADVDLLYIATPHSHHFDITKKAILAGKPCIVEKAFMPNARMTEEILKLSAEKGVFVAEAIWPRYQPARRIINEIIGSGEIGEVKIINGSLAYSISHVDRIIKPELCGGALLDVGVYALNFMFMVHDTTIKSITTSCIKSDSGVDFQNAMSFIFEDGVMANLQSSACCETDKLGVVSGTKGFLTVDNINNPQLIRVFAHRGDLIKEVRVPEQISGYEYEFMACRDAMAAGQIEPADMPHAETLKVMKIMDHLRHEWGVVYPMD